MEYGELDGLIRRAHVRNGWFTEGNVRHAFGAWSKALTSQGLTEWIATYEGLGAVLGEQRTVGLILAGNIPLVGFHDLLCVWLSGHRAKVKLSSQDSELIPALIKALDEFLPGTAAAISFEQGKLGEIDAIIATGSNNTARYFEHYFGHLPRIVRKSRNSVAVLDGTETDEELIALGEDVLRYFGMGCRSVSKLFVPEDFDLDRFFQAVFGWKDMIQHNKYANNYDYTRALWMLDAVDFLENGFLLVKEDTALASPVATVFYERYSDAALVDGTLAARSLDLQCIVGHKGIPFGQAQYPALSDYADGVDTLQFLGQLT
ncbi:MAG: acyl-CoA reductase [Flavobacteriales bacterium]|nr:acyl-CoA reductase [Flavobacteriales bacterium]